MAKNRKSKIKKPERSSGLSDDLFAGEENVFGDMFDEEKAAQPLPIKSASIIPEQTLPKSEITAAPKKVQEKKKLICPITLAPFKLPIKVKSTDASGKTVEHTYDAYALREWLQGSQSFKDPLTNKPIEEIEELEITPTRQEELALQSLSEREISEQKTHVREIKNIVKDAKCSLSLDTLQNPVEVFPSGKVYEASYIKNSIESGNTRCPLTNIEIKSVAPSIHYRKKLGLKDELNRDETEEIKAVETALQPTIAAKQPEKAILVRAYFSDDEYKVYDCNVLKSLFETGDNTDPETGRPFVAIKHEDNNPANVSATVRSEVAETQRLLTRVNENKALQNSEASNPSRPVPQITPAPVIDSADLDCPITKMRMENPVRVLPSGKVYEASAIKEWLTHKNTDPLTRQVITNIEPALDFRKALDRPETLTDEEKDEVAAVKNAIPAQHPVGNRVARQHSHSPARTPSAQHQAFSGRRYPPPRTLTSPSFVDRNPVHQRNSKNLSSILLMAVVVDVYQRSMIQQMPSSKGLPPTYIYIEFVVQVTSVIMLSNSLENTGGLAVVILSERILQASFHALIDHKPVAQPQQQKIQPNCDIEAARQDAPSLPQQRMTLTS